jgi:1,4-dihydroxy-2-naphthoate octaprenyltransferase
MPTSSFQIWVAATRPRTLAAAVVPVALGTALAFADGKASPVAAAIALVCALLIQIATNFINELYDFRKGADTHERLGPLRAVAAGLITEAQMKRASIAVLGLAFVLGLFLVAIGGWPILAIGLASIFFAWAYTGGPYPLAYNGLGDVFVFIFFGLVAVCGTYYAQTLSLTWEAAVVALVPAALATNILGVNNLRDIPTDAKVGKRTLAVRIGAKAARALYYALTVMAFAVPLMLFGLGYKWPVLVSLLLLPVAVQLCIQVSQSEGKALNVCLAGTAKLLVLFGVVLTVGLCVGKLL